MTDSRQPLTVVHVIHSLGAGGAESVLVELARSAPATGVRMVVIGLSDADDDRNAHRLADAGATVYQLHAGRYDLTAVRRVAAIVRRERGDVVHTHLKHADLVGGLAARMVGVPAVSTLHVIESAPTSPLHAARVRAAVLGRSALAARVIALSTAQREWYASLAASAPMMVIPNGVREPAPTRDRADVRRELGVDERAVLALTVSLMRPEKGHAVALDAVRRLPADSPVVLALAGDGPLLDQVRAEVSADDALRRRVRVLGFRPDVDDLLAACDLVVHPSHEDALPTSLISALASGRPIVATRVGGIPDIVGEGDDSAGVLVPPADPDALATAVATLAADPGRRGDLGRAGRTRYERTFSATVWAESLRGAYDQVLLGPAEHLYDGPVRSVAVVSAVAPYPSDSGKSMVIAGFLRHLRSRVPADQIHYLHVGSPLRSHDGFEGVQVHEMGRPSRLDQVRSLVRRVALSRASLQEAFLASPRVRSHVQQTLTDVDADLEIVDTVRMAQHVQRQRGRGRRVLYLDDLFSVRYSRMLEVLHDEDVDADFDPLGQFSSNVPQALHGLTQLPLTRRLLLRFERRRVRLSELRAAREHEVSVLLNEQEATDLSRETGARVVSVPPSIPRLAEVADNPDLWQGDPSFVFVGLLSLAHNHDGLVWFLQEGMPELLARRPDAVLHVVGRDASESLLHEAARYGSSVVVHGYVADLDDLLARSCALVNPLRFGSGIKIKTLDALARGLPVVCTPVAAEGIVPGSVPGVRVVADAREAAAALVELVDPEHRAAEAEGARRLYAERFSDPVVGEIYDEVFTIEGGA